MFEPAVVTGPQLYHTIIITKSRRRFFAPISASAIQGDSLPLGHEFRNLPTKATLKHIDIHRTGDVSLFILFSRPDIQNYNSGVSNGFCKFTCINGFESGGPLLASKQAQQLG